MPSLEIFGVSQILSKKKWEKSFKIGLNHLKLT